MVEFLDGLLEHKCSDFIAAAWRVSRLAIGNVMRFDLEMPEKYCR